MRASIRHTTRYEYAPSAHRIALKLKLFPAQFASQRVVSWDVAVNGESVTALVVNGFGDREAIWTSQTPQAMVEISAQGIVECDDSAGILRGFYELARPCVFLRTTRLTTPSPRLEALAAKAVRATPLETLHALSDLVRDAVVYTPGSTHAAMTADEAITLGKGVCQDQAHVFVVAARRLGCPARYVVGYLTQGVESQPDTHAWAEAYVGDLGWIGFDPANQQCPTQAYVRLASGLDALDAAPVRGCVGPGATERLSARVEITEIEQAHQQQSQ